MSTEVTYDRNMEPIFTEIPEIVSSAERAEQEVAEIREAGDGKVSIIVLCWNQLKYTRICIESIKEHTEPGRYQVIAVDQGSTDGTLDYLGSVLTEPEHVVIRNPENRGFSGGNNQALRLAEHEYVLFLNNDCKVLSSDWLDVLIRGTAKADLIGARCMKDRVDVVRRQFVPVGRAHEGEKWSYLEGWCLFAKRELFQRLNGFDMRFNPAYSDDADLSFRVKQMGLKIKAIRVPVEHFGNKTESLIRKAFGDQSEKSNRLLFDKWIGGDISPGAKSTRQQGKPSMLIRRKGARGDVLMLTPIFRELKKKYQRSFLVVETECPDVLVGNPYIDHIERYIPRPGDYDLVFAPRYEQRPRDNAIDVMAEQCGVSLKSRTMDIVLGPSEIEWAKGKVRDQVCIAAHTGRSWRSREWPIERFRELFGYYAEKGYTILELGDKDTALTGVGRDFRRCSIKHAAALIRESIVFMGIDSVCANLAKAVGTPACIIYGCVDPASRRADAVEYPMWIDDLECRGCRNRTSAEYVECTKPEIYCLTMVTVKMVIEKLKMVIG